MAVCGLSAVELARVGEQQAPDVGGLDRAAVALQHRRAHLGLQRLDAARQGRLRQVHRLGGPAEAAMLDHGDEVAQLAQFHE